MINKGSTVTFKYVGKISGEEQPFGAETVKIQVGTEQLIEGLTTALMGKNSGDVFNVSIPHTQAYGEFNPELTRRVKLEELPQDEEPTVGKILTASSSDNENGSVTVTIVEINKEEGYAVLDFNHPLVNKDLEFTIEILEVQ